MKKIKFPPEPTYLKPLLGVFDRKNSLLSEFAFEEGQLPSLNNKNYKYRPITGEISKIHLYHNDYARLIGFRFYDKKGKIIYESALKSAFNTSYVKQHEILL